MVRLMGLICLISLVGCNQAVSPRDDVKVAELKPSCAAINGIDDLLADDGPEIIVIGELHGMTAPPAFVEALVCHSLKKGLKTSLALEVSDQEGLIDAYMKSDGGEAAKASLFEDWMWKGMFTDGRSSLAMLDLLDAARTLKQSQGLKVIPFKADDLEVEQFIVQVDAETEPAFDQNAYSAAYEKSMAEKILSGAKKNASDKTFVLVGGVHARRTRVQFGDLDYEAMAAHMPRPQTLTFNSVYTSGTSWNCTGGKPSDCGESNSLGSIDAESQVAKSGIYTIINAEGLAVIPDISEKAFQPDTYDGVVFVGAAKASPPANLQNRVPYKPNAKE